MKKNKIIQTNNDEKTDEKMRKMIKKQTNIFKESRDIKRTKALYRQITDNIFICG